MALPPSTVDPNDVTSIIQKILALSIDQIDGVMGAGFAKANPEFLLSIFQASQNAYFQAVNLAQRLSERQP